MKVKDSFTPAEVVKDHNIPARHLYDHALNGFATAKIPPGLRDEIESDSRVAYIEIDQKVHILGDSNDTLPWGVDRIDAEVVWGGSDGAKDVSGNAGGGQQVAVVDTGIDYTHPDLDGPYQDGYDFVNDDDDPKDDCGHGTHVSGTIAAEDGDGDVIGVAPEVELYALKALDKQGSGYLSDVVAGIEWAIEGPDGKEGNDDDAEVVSMSLGASSGSTSLKKAVNNALASGTLPVAAAGNSGDGDCSTTETSYPAAYRSVIAVGATDKDDSIASFSNSGDYLELAAPGVDILSTMPTYKVYMNGRYHMSQDYDTMDGTSMACPHVSGTAALVFAADVTDSEGDGNKADDVRSILDSTAEDLGHSETCQGNGLVDAEAAVNSVGTGDPPSVSWKNPTDGEEVSGSVTIQIDASDSEDSDDSLTVEWQVDDGTWNTASYDSDSGYYEDTWESTEVSDGSRNLDAKATDSDGNTDTSSITVTVNNNEAPTVTIENPLDGDNVSGTIDITAKASDTDGSVDQIEFFVDGSSVGTDSDGSDGWSTTWDSTEVDDGDHTIKATATDDDGESSSDSISITVNNVEAGGMYVWDISWKEAGPHLKSTVTIRYDSDGDGVAESSDDPVADANVEFTLTHDTDEDGAFEPGTDDDSKVFTSTTDSKGQVEFMWKQAPSGEYKGEVTDLTHSSYSWNSSLDNDNPDYYEK